MFPIIPSHSDLKAIVLSNSQNDLDDKVRQGRISPSVHAMAVETIKASRMEWHKAKEYLEAMTGHGYLETDELPTCLSVCAEICQSRLD